MSFIAKHNPANINDLVFRSADVEAIVREYAERMRDKHLLLHGPAGSGKSIAAHHILSTHVGDLIGTAVARPINPRDYEPEDFEPLMRDWNAQRMNGLSRGYTVIDEVDFFSDKMLQKLRAFIDSTDLGTIICTTNNLHKLDEPFKDRFRKLLVERPTAEDWTLRAQTILAAEGVTLATEQVSVLLKGFEGSARELIEWLEDYTLKFKRQSSLAKPTPATGVTIGGVTLPANKTLINWHSLASKKDASK